MLIGFLGDRDLGAVAHDSGPLSGFVSWGTGCPPCQHSTVSLFRATQYRAERWPCCHGGHGLSCWSWKLLSRGHPTRSPAWSSLHSLSPLMDKAGNHGLRHCSWVWFLQGTNLCCAMHGVGWWWRPPCPVRTLSRVPSLWPDTGNCRSRGEACSGKKAFCSSALLPQPSG